MKGSWALFTMRIYFLQNRKNIIFFLENQLLTADFPNLEKFYAESKQCKMCYIARGALIFEIRNKKTVPVKFNGLWATHTGSRP